MEHEPDFKTIGKASDETKEEVKKTFKKLLCHHLESLPPELKDLFEKNDLPKTEQEIALIDLANEETYKLMQKVGARRPYKIPRENIHILPNNIYQELTQSEKSAGATITSWQAIILNEYQVRRNPVYFVHIVAHELLHLKGYFCLEVQEKQNGVHITPYREGLKVISSQRNWFEKGYHSHFRGLEEALVSETTKKILKKMINHSLLKKEKEWLMSEEAKEKIKQIARKTNTVEDDIFWLNPQQKNEFMAIPFSRQREVLNYVCQEIQQQFSDQYKTLDDVFDLFLKAHFNGNLLDLAKLVEKTFGKGSFRLLGQMDLDEKSAKTCLETLKKRRKKIKKANKK